MGWPRFVNRRRPPRPMPSSPAVPPAPTATSGRSRRQASTGQVGPSQRENHGFGRTLGGGGWFIHRPTLPWACPAGYQSQVVTTNTIRHSCVRMRWSTSIPTWDDRHSGACASSK